MITKIIGWFKRCFGPYQHRLGWCDDKGYYYRTADPDEFLKFPDPFSMRIVEQVYIDKYGMQQSTGVHIAWHMKDKPPEHLKKVQDHAVR